MIHFFSKKKLKMMIGEMFFRSFISGMRSGNKMHATQATKKLEEEQKRMFI